MRIKSALRPLSNIDNHNKLFTVASVADHHHSLYHQAERKSPTSNPQTHLSYRESPNYLTSTTPTHATMPPTLSTPSATTLAKRSYHSSGNSAIYYQGRMVGIIFGVVVFCLLLLWALTYRHKKNKRLRSLDPVRGPLAFAPGGVLSPVALPPPPYVGPPGQEPTWNGTQWQGPKGEDGSEGLYWNGLNWCKESGPVWNGVTWVNAGRVNGVFVPMNEQTGRVWNGSEWIGGWPGTVQQGSVQMNGRTPQEHVAPPAEPDSGVIDWYKRDAESGVQAPVLAYTGEESRRDSLRRDGVNADGGLGHVATQSRDFGAPKHNATAAATAAPEAREEKESGFTRLLKSVRGGK